MIFLYLWSINVLRKTHPKDGRPSRGVVAKAVVVASLPKLFFFFAFVSPDSDSASTRQSDLGDCVCVIAVPNVVVEEGGEDGGVEEGRTGN